MQVLITLQCEFTLLRVFPKTLESTPVIEDRRRVGRWKKENKMVNFVVVDRGLVPARPTSDSPVKSLPISASQMLLCSGHQSRKIVDLENTAKLSLSAIQ